MNSVCTHLFQSLNKITMLQPSDFESECVPRLLRLLVTLHIPTTLNGSLSFSSSTRCTKFQNGLPIPVTYERELQSYGRLPSHPHTVLCSGTHVPWTIKSFIKTQHGGFICKYADMSQYAGFPSAYHLESAGVENMSEG